MLHEALCSTLWEHIYNGIKEKKKKRGVKLKCMFILLKKVIKKEDTAALNGTHLTHIVDSCITTYCVHWLKGRVSDSTQFIPQVQYHISTSANSPSQLWSGYVIDKCRKICFDIYESFCPFHKMQHHSYLLTLRN